METQMSIIFNHEFILAVTEFILSCAKFISFTSFVNKNAKHNHENHELRLRSFNINGGRKISLE